MMLRVEMRPLSGLVPYARNARTHSPEQVGQIAASIAEFGFVNPVLVGDDDVIVAGHGRVMAAERLGIREVPVIVLAHLSVSQRRALTIADNKIAENAGWDEAMLRAELADLKLEAVNLGILGFSEEDLAGLLGDEDLDDAPAHVGDPDFVPDVGPAPVTRRGDLWVLGEHRLLCGDSTRLADAKRLCGGSPVDAVWTDPPYGVNYEGVAGSIANDDLPPDEFLRFLTAALATAAAMLRPGGPIYVAHADTEGLAFRTAFRDAGLKLSGCLVWVKPSLVLGRSDYQWRHEPILYGWKPGAAHSWYGGRAQTTVRDAAVAGGGLPLRVMPDGTLQIDVGDQTVVIRGEAMSIETWDGSVLRAERPSRNDVHPTMKPVGLVLRMLENSTRRRDRVLDLFGGSGSTLIACEKAGRIARIMELDERFCDVIVERWQTFTGREARRVET